MKSFLIYIVCINLISIIACCADKVSAIKGTRRVSEGALLWISAFGGAISMYITMRIIRHKTRHNKFMVGLPVIMLLQIAIILILKFNIL